MPDITIRSDHVDVEQIMRQIRMRIKEKRGADYTEDEVRTLATATLESFLNPRAIRSDLVEHYRRRRPMPPLPSDPPPEPFEFENETIYASSRVPLLARVRHWLSPLLKLFFNPNPIIQALHRQARMNTFVAQRLTRFGERFAARDELDALNFEVLNNVALELTRLGLEVKSLRMQIESMNARQEFSEHRARAFEGVVIGSPAPAVGVEEPPSAAGDDAEGRTRRRRRRRGRRRREGEPAASGPTGVGEDRAPAPEPPSSEPDAEQ
jgi:hypothetical protein